MDKRCKVSNTTESSSTQVHIRAAQVMKMFMVDLQAYDELLHNHKKKLQASGTLPPIIAFKSSKKILKAAAPKI